MLDLLLILRPPTLASILLAFSRHESIPLKLDSFILLLFEDNWSCPLLIFYDLDLKRWGRRWAFGDIVSWSVTRMLDYLFLLSEKMMSLLGCLSFLEGHTLFIELCDVHGYVARVNLILGMRCKNSHSSHLWTPLVIGGPWALKGLTAYVPQLLD